MRDILKHTPNVNASLEFSDEASLYYVEDIIGLPALVLIVELSKTTIVATKIVLKPKEQIQIKKPTKGKTVSYEEYALEIKWAKKEYLVIK
jgi:hypothetical protein